jgi:hypothetical protein
LTIRLIIGPSLDQRSMHCGICVKHANNSNYGSKL